VTGPGLRKLSYFLLLALTVYVAASGAV